MKLTTGILLAMLTAGTALGQNADVLDNVRNTMQAVERKKEIDTNAVLNSSPTAAPAPAAPGRPAEAASTASVKPAPGKAVASAPAPLPAVKKPASTGSASSSKPAVAQKDGPKKVAAKKDAAKKVAPKKVETVAVEAAKTAPADTPKKAPEKTINLTGRRDPFVSPVVNRSMVGSGCSTGKRCLAIDQISLKGVVKSDTGMIAVVENALEKAYFLRENDPVFNGYVVKITGDSIIFKETVQDKLGKPFTREVTKKITAPAV
jgi:Tfp pilus assembly protein PilP